MAVLHALLANRPEARAKADLAPLVDKYDALVTDHRFLLVPYHLIGKSSVEEAILGSYLAAVRRRHPDAPLPAVLADAPLLETARRLRKQFGDDAFFATTRFSRSSPGTAARPTAAGVSSPPAGTPRGSTPRPPPGPTTRNGSRSSSRCSRRCRSTSTSRSAAASPTSASTTGSPRSASTRTGSATPRSCSSSTS